MSVPVAEIFPLLATVNLGELDAEAVKRSPVPFWLTIRPALARVAAVLTLV